MTREEAIQYGTAWLKDEYLDAKDKLFVSMAIKALEQEPKTGHCKDCKWWRDSDGTFRRGIGAKSQCPINRIEVFNGNGYCYMYESQESEEMNDIQCVSYGGLFRSDRSRK